MSHLPNEQTETTVALTTEAPATTPTETTETTEALTVAAPNEPAETAAALVHVAPAKIAKPKAKAAAPKPTGKPVKKASKMAREELLTVVGPAAKTAKPAKPAKPAPSKITTTAPAAKIMATAPAAKVTFASRCRELIHEGKTNAEIWAILEPELGCKPQCKSHPAWYRSQMAREAAGGGKRSGKVSAYSTTLAFFIDNCPNVKAVLKAPEPSFAIKMLAQATGRTVEQTLAGLRARITQ
jgi:hypothetical protein